MVTSGVSASIGAPLAFSEEISACTVGMTSVASPAARAWIQCLRSPAAQAIFRAKGYVVAG